MWDVVLLCWPPPPFLVLLFSSSCPEIVGFEFEVEGSKAVFSFALVGLSVRGLGVWVEYS
jgi:hypothetical protein